jgi:hypothetical protein
MGKVRSKGAEGVREKIFPISIALSRESSPLI